MPQWRFLQIWVIKTMLGGSTGLNKYKCDIYDRKNYRIPSISSTVMMAHAGEKPYKCN